MSAASSIVDVILEADKKQPKSVPPPSITAPDVTPEEMSLFVISALEYGSWLKLKHLQEKYDLVISGKVERTDHHYVHERTTTFTLYVEFSEDVPPEVEKWVDDNANIIEAEIYEKIVDINHKIYRALEREWDYRNSDEAVAETIIANEYDFDEDGDRGGDLRFEQLSDEAKEKAMDWYRSSSHDDDIHEFIYEEWINELEKMGLGYPDISYSGFSSQGDGASFTTNHFDFDKWVDYWVSGKDAEQGPMSDPVTESLDPAAQADAEISRMAREVAFDDYSQLIPKDDRQEGNTTAYWELVMSDDRKIHGYIHLWVSRASGGAETCVVDVRLTAWDDPPSTEPEERKWGIKNYKDSGSIDRKTKFFIPKGARGSFLAGLSDFLDYLKGVINRRKGEHLPVHPKKFLNSIAYKLSKFGGIWKRDHAAERTAHIKTAARMLDLAKKVSSRQESDSSDMLNHVSQSALAGSFPFETFMQDASNRYWNGSKQYRRTFVARGFTGSVTVSTFPLELKDQPWEIGINLKDLETTHIWSMHLLITGLEEKANLGPMTKELVDKLGDLYFESPQPSNISTARRQKEFLDTVAGIFNGIFRTAAAFEEV